VLIETAQAMGTGNLIENLLDLDFGAPSTSTASSPAFDKKNSLVMDLLSMDLEPMASLTKQEIFLTAENAQGLDLRGNFTNRNEQLFLDLTFKNQSASEMSQFAIQFNVNSYGLVPAQLVVPTLAPNGTAVVHLALLKTGTPQAMTPANLLQIAIKNNNGVYYFAAHIPLQFV
jgi:hypothetical protein